MLRSLREACEYNIIRKASLAQQGLKYKLDFMLPFVWLSFMAIKKDDFVKCVG